MKDYIDRETAIKICKTEGYNIHDIVFAISTIPGKTIPAVDAVEVDTVCDMFMYVMRDECPCNYCGVDEWLPEACELIDECPHPTDKMGCWKQFIKHYPTRMDYMDSLAAEAEKKRMDGRREDGDA